MSVSRLVGATVLAALAAIGGSLGVAGCESGYRAVTDEPAVIETVYMPLEVEWSLAEALPPDDAEAISKELRQRHISMLFPGGAPTGYGRPLSVRFVITVGVPTNRWMKAAVAIYTQGEAGPLLLSLGYVKSDSPPSTTETGDWQEVEVRGQPGRAGRDDLGRWLLEWEEAGQPLQASFGGGDRLLLKEAISWLDSWYVLPSDGTGPGTGVGTGEIVSAAKDLALYPIQVDDKWGFIDETGTIVIEPRFVEQPVFVDGLAAAAAPGAGGEPSLGPTVWGFIDTTGAWVIEPRFEWVLAFSEGLAPSQEPGGLYGFIDKTGAWAIQPQFSVVSPFAEGLAGAGYSSPDGSNECGFIDKTGAWVIEPRKQWDYAGGFSEGIGTVQTGNLIGYIDKTGKVLVEPKYGYAQPFSGGLALVRTHPAENTHLYGFIDKTGAEVIEPQYEDAQPFSGGLARVRVDGKGSGWIDSTGAWVIEPQFQNADDFSEGLAAVWADGRWGYIDKSGAWAIEPRFDRAGPFSEGLAVAGMAIREQVRPYDDPYLYGYIDTTGAWVIPPRFLNAAPFEGPLAQAWVDGRRGYIDLAGEFVFSRPWESPTQQK